MEALVIIYDGHEISPVVLDQIVALIGANCKIKGNVSTYQLSEEDIAERCVEALINNRSYNKDQVAIDKAVTYLTEMVLKKYTSPIMIGYAICKYIEAGDERMRAAVEIIATVNGEIHEPKLTKPVINSIKSIWDNIK